MKNRFFNFLVISLFMSFLLLSCFDEEPQNDSSKIDSVLTEFNDSLSDNATALFDIANQEFEREEYEFAKSAYIKAAENGYAYSEYCFYNIACCNSSLLVGDDLSQQEEDELISEAIYNLSKSYDLGFDDLDHYINDSDLYVVRRSDLFTEWFSQKAIDLFNQKIPTLESWNTIPGAEFYFYDNFDSDLEKEIAIFIRYQGLHLNYPFILLYKASADGFDLVDYKLIQSEVDCFIRDSHQFEPYGFDYSTTAEKELRAFDLGGTISKEIILESATASQSRFVLITFDDGIKILPTQTYQFIDSISYDESVGNMH